MRNINDSDKVRLDQLVFERGLSNSRTQAQQLIRLGSVWVDGEPVRGPGRRVSRTASLVCTHTKRQYVSRGGVKLRHALDVFRINPKGWMCADWGAGRGGFTDCLLQAGAQWVYSYDVGHSQLDEKLQNHPQVSSFERTNVRFLTPGQIMPFDLIVMDLSFISLALVMPAVAQCLRPGGALVCLVKPQYEVGRQALGKSGVVHGAHLHEKTLQQHITLLEAFGMGVRGLTFSPLLGGSGNREFFSWSQQGVKSVDVSIEKIVSESHEFVCGEYQEFLVTNK